MESTWCQILLSVCLRPTSWAPASTCSTKTMLSLRVIRGPHHGVIAELVWPQTQNHWWNHLHFSIQVCFVKRLWHHSIKMFLWYVQVDLVFLSTLRNRDTFTSMSQINTVLSQQMIPVPMTGAPSIPQSATISSPLAPLSLASTQEPRGQHLEKAPEQRAYHWAFVLELMPISANHSLFCIHFFHKTWAVPLCPARSRLARIHTFTFPQNQRFPTPLQPWVRCTGIQKWPSVRTRMWTLPLSYQRILHPLQKNQVFTVLLGSQLR